tara:strand:- start:70 stop:267 length:198 start_codon:yes stop_codon:yes gene_type:complete
VEDQHKKLQNGLLRPKKERSKYLKDYQIDCEECEETSYVAAYDKPKFCPLCGRRAEPEEVDNVGL